MDDDGFPFHFHEATPGVLFGKDSPSMKEFLSQGAPMVYQSGKRRRSPSAAAPRASKLATRRVTRKALPSTAAYGSGWSDVVTLPGAEDSDAPSIDQVTAFVLPDGYFIGFGCLIAFPFAFAG